MTIDTEILSAILIATQVFSIFFIIILVYELKLAKSEKYGESYYDRSKIVEDLQSEKRDLQHQIFLLKNGDEKVKRNMEKLLSLHTCFRLKYDSEEALYCIDKYIDALSESIEIEDENESDNDNE